MRYDAPSKPKQKQKLVKVIGHKPIINFNLNGKNFEGLWDTGSMISLLDIDFLKKEFGDIKIESVENFIGEKAPKLTLRTANHSKMDIVGVVTFDFEIPNTESKFTVPFIVTNCSISNPIIGFNIIEHLVKENINKNFNPILKLFPNLNDTKVELVTNLIEENSKVSDIIGTVKNSENVKLAPNSFSFVKCKFKNYVFENRSLPVIFQPNLDLSTDFVTTENLVRINPSKSKTIKIPIYNPTSKEIFIRSNSLIGSLERVAAAIPLEIKPIEIPADVSNINLDTKNTENTKNNWLPEVDLSHLPDEQRVQVEKVLIENCDVFSKNDLDIGRIESLKLKLNVTDSTSVCKPYRSIPKQLYSEVKQYLEDLITNDWIKTSYSSYASPMVCARKPNGLLRLCIDYRELNKKIQPDRIPIPRLQDILDNLGGQKFFTTLDMSKAYYQGFMDKESQHFTAFTTPWGLYEWLRIPFGLSSAPPAFQRFMNECLSGLRDSICIPYLDDILCYGKSFSEHLENLGTVLKRLRQFGVKLRAEKCSFFKSEVKYLGKIINEKGYRDDPITTKAIDKLEQPPKTVGDLQKLLGFLGYYRQSIKDFSRKAKPLYDISSLPSDNQKLKSKKSKGQKSSNELIQWTDDHKNIVLDLIDELKSPKIMSYPDFSKPFVVHCDASEKGLGAVLYQEIDGTMKVISYASRTLTPAEKNYHLHSGKLEFLALKWSVTEKFHDYLYYAKEFTVYSDNNPLSYVLTSAKLNATGLRWVSELSNYNFKIKYRPGKKSQDCDYLSRYPVENDFENFTEETNLEHVSTFVNSISYEDNWLTVTAKDPEILETYLQLEPKKDVIKITCENLKKEQMNDEVISPVYDAILSKKRPSFEEQKLFTKKTKTILNYWQKLKINDQGLLVNSTKSVDQILLPQKFYSIVYKELHENMGHLGPDRVTELCKSRFYWPGYEKDITNFIRKKCKCIKDKKPNRQQLEPLQNIITHEPFELITLDYLHLDQCKGGYEYLLVVVDHFSKFAQAFPTKNKSGRAAADILFNKYFLDFGFPKRILHDQGKEFDNKLFQRLSEITGIKPSRTTPYHPMGNGLCERMNRTILNMLKTLPKSFKSNWKDHIKKLTFAYNNTKHKSTNFTPHFLLFGREGRLPIDNIFNIDVSSSNNISHSKYVQNWQKAMQEVYSKIQNNNKSLQNKSKSYYDRKIFGSTLNVGDRVLLKNLSERGGTGKLRSFFEDDIYCVDSCHPELPIYKIKPEKGGNKIRTVHRNLLMKCNDFPIETKSPFSTLSTKLKSKTKEKQNKNHDSSSCDSDSDFEYVVVKRKTKNRKQSEKEGEGSNTNSDLNSSEQNSEQNDNNNDNNHNISNIPTRTKRHRKPKKIFTYDTLGIPSYQNG